MSVNRDLKKYGYYCGSLFDFNGDTPSLASMFGCVETIPGFNLTQKLTPKSEISSTPNTYSGIYGLNEFPLHTDLAHWRTPPRYIFLRCLVGEASVPTFILRFSEILSELGENTVGKALFKPRRPLNGKMFLLRFRDSNIIRWDRSFIVPANRHAVTIAKYISEIHAERCEAITLQKTNDFLIIDNWKTMHGRGAIPENSHRHIDRIYMTGVF